jgi:hypothetical protein
MNMAARFLVVRATFAVRRAERERRRTLERELAGFSSPADLLEIETIIDRYPPGQTLEVRSILTQQGMRSLLAQQGLRAGSLTPGLNYPRAA